MYSSIIQLVSIVQIFEQFFPFIHAFGFFKYLVKVLRNAIFIFFSFFTIGSIFHCLLHIFFIRFTCEFSYAHFFIQALRKFTTNALPWTSYAYFAKRE